MAFDYIPLWDRYQALFEALTLEDIGRLVVAMLDYKAGLEPEIQGDARIVWPSVRYDIDTARASYDSLCENRREAGKKGGRNKKEEAAKKQTEANKANASFALQTEANKANASFALQTKQVQANEANTNQTNTNQTNTNQTTSPNGEGDTRARGRRFTPPTLAEVQSYVAERHSPVDPQGFIDFYESKGWMVGKTPMKDWKAACRNAENWERWTKPAPKSTSLAPDPNYAQKRASPGQQAQRDVEELHRLVAELGLGGGGTG